MFDRFFQADEDRGGRRFGGLGLGLYITRAIIETHGGAIRAQPNAEAGRGTMIRFTLPLTARVPEAFRITGGPAAVRHAPRLDSGACPPCAPSGRSPTPRSASPNESFRSAFACPMSRTRSLLAAR